MATISLHDHDVATLVSALADIHEIREIDLDEDEEVRYALANLIGELREQIGATERSPATGMRPRVSLEDMMARKFSQWEEQRIEEDAGGRSADEVLESQLDNAGRSVQCFVGGLGASSSVDSFRAALDDSKAWTQYEVQLCASTTGELEDLTLGDMAHSLTLAG